jgi:septal ring factor EnvC (AmiA/AmiB activator)
LTALRPALALLLLLAAAPVAIAADEDPRARLEQVEADLEKLEGWLRSRRIDRDELAEQLRESDLAVAEMAAAVREAEEALTDQRRRIEAIEAEIEELVQLEALQRKALEDQLRSAWLLSRRDPLQVLLETEAPDRVGRLLHYHRTLTRSRTEALERWEQARDALRESRTELAREADRLREKRDRLAARVAELESTRSERQRVLAALEARIDQREDARAELLRDRQRLMELLERLAREARVPTGRAFTDARGRLPWPVAPQILRAFGSSGEGGLAADGVMLQAEAGTPVRVVAAGRVVFADWMRGFGLMIIVDHGGGYMSLYAQAESLLRGDGDTVEAGEPIATAGQSGGSARAGVWFEIRSNRRPQDPITWCVPRAQA